MDNSPGQPGLYFFIMAISWYPHHMAKALEEIDRVSSVIDAIIYMADSRAPFSSINQELLRKDKPVFILFNKADLINKKELDIWKKYYSELGIKSFPVVSINSENARRALKNIKTLLGKKIIYLLVVGVPNVGKSMFIRNSSSSKIKIGARPGVTNKVSWLKATNGCYLADTPGILWPRMEADNTYYKLCAIESIGEKMVDYESLFQWLLAFLLKYPQNFKKRYNIDLKENLEENISNLMKITGKNVQNIYKTVINDFRKGHLGKLIIDDISEN